MRPFAGSRPPIIRIANGTFYRHHPSAASAHPNPPLFAHLDFELPSHSPEPHHWCVVGPSLSGKTTLLQILRGQHLCFPPTARSFPYLATEHVPHRLRNPQRAIQYVGFDSGSSLGPATSAYLSARYESRREQTDFSLLDFLLGNTQLNPPAAGETAEEEEAGVSRALLDRVVADLRLGPLLELPVAFLSNGQGRRARIARALLTRPEVLLLDEPFMGLDPPTVAGLSPLLRDLAARSSPRLVLSARPQDPLPDWITHLVYLRTDCQIGAMGRREAVLEGLRGYFRGVWTGGRPEDDKMPVHALSELGRVLTERGIEGRGLVEEVAVAATPAAAAGRGDDPAPEESVASAPGSSSSSTTTAGEPLVEMEGCQVRYGDRIALGDWTTDKGTKVGLHWTVRRGERWGVFGPNGSGKTTIVSLLCSDHPQAYSLPLRLFGRSRLPEPGSGQRPLTFWDIQARIGHSSPEIHQHMPRGLTIRQVLQSAWADTFRARPQMDAEARAQADATLAWFARELNPASSGGEEKKKNKKEEVEDSLAWADEYTFGEMSFSAQRVLLFLRAVVRHPDVVVLDEAFGGMDEAVRDKCMLFLEHGEAKRYARGGGGGGGGGGSLAVEDSEAARAGRVRVTGLSERQALICISHVREEVPDCVREWMCLPEANTGKPARFGRLEGPLRKDHRRWEEVWRTE